MGKIPISTSLGMKKGMLDDDYILYDDGTILHKYDKNIYPGGQSLTEDLTVPDLKEEVKRRLLDDASDEHKELVRNILNIDNG
jgi:hypothetical protein